MKTNEAGLALIKQSEGLRLSAYQDSVGVWTIGYGSTGMHVHPGQTITEAEADKFLREDLEIAENAVSRLVKVPLTENQFSALVSFTFNLGGGALERSTLLRLLNKGEKQKAADEFKKWVRAGNDILPGLIKRRAAEKALFLTE